MGLLEVDGEPGKLDAEIETIGEVLIVRVLVSISSSPWKLIERTPVREEQIFPVEIRLGNFGIVLHRGACRQTVALGPKVVTFINAVHHVLP